MKYYFKIGFLAIATFLLSFQALHVEAFPNKQSFEQWCLQKDTLQVDTKKTVDLLLKIAKTNEKAGLVKQTFEWSQ